MAPCKRSTATQRAAHISHLPDSELNHNFRSILLSFENWLQTARKEEIARNYEEIGRIRPAGTHSAP